MIDIQDKLRAEDTWKRGDISTALGIMERNPNVGLEVRSFRNDSTVTFSIFGKGAADFLFGLAKDIASGALVAATPAQAAAHLNNMRYGPASPQTGQQGKNERDPTKVPNRKADSKELAFIGAEVQRLLENEDCRTFIEKLLADARGFQPLGWMIADNVNNFFDMVANGGGFYLAPTATYSTATGDINAGTGAVYLAVSDPKTIKWDPKFWTPALIRQGGQRWVTEAAKRALHELIHLTAFGDKTLALAVAKIKGEQKTFADTWEGFKEASKYWDAELRNNCK
jgi:hypothetical protein